MTLINLKSTEMKIITYVLIIFCSVEGVKAQNNSGYRIISSTTGSSGSSQSISTFKGTYKISQSVGQNSVIGTYYNNGYYLRQGYQQPLDKRILIKGFDSKLRARIYPNPFSQFVYITFSTSIQSDISVIMFDVNSKVIHSQKFLPSQEIELRLRNISEGIYFLKVLSGKKRFNTKLIKI